MIWDGVCENMWWVCGCECGRIGGWYRIWYVVNDVFKYEENEK